MADIVTKPTAQGHQNTEPPLTDLCEVRSFGGIALAMDDLSIRFHPDHHSTERHDRLGYFRKEENVGPGDLMALREGIEPWIQNDVSIGSRWDDIAPQGNRTCRSHSDQQARQERVLREIRVRTTLFRHRCLSFFYQAVLMCDVSSFLSTQGESNDRFTSKRREHQEQVRPISDSLGGRKQRSVLLDRAESAQQLPGCNRS